MNNCTYFLLALLLMTVACRPRPEKNKPSAYHLAAPHAFRTACPALCRDAQGRLVLSWVQADTAGNTEVYFARYDSSEGRFGNPQGIPTSSGVMLHGENLPHLVFAAGGRALVVFGTPNPTAGNPYTGAIHYSWSSDGGKNWMPARKLAADTDGLYDQRYFDVSRLADNRMGLLWLRNSQPEGSTLCFAASTGEGFFSRPTVIARTSCQCCRTVLLADSSGKLAVSWRNIFPGEIRDMAFSTSDDGGKTFSAPERISEDNWHFKGCPHSGPAMVANRYGLHFTWFTMGQGGGIYYARRDTAGLFSKRQAVSAVPSARHPQMCVEDNGNILTVWDEQQSEHDQDGRRIGIQRRGPTGQWLMTGYITPPEGDATFPQIELLNKSEALVAYTEQMNNRQEVRYKIVRL